jgi:intein/homing endonuclease
MQNNALNINIAGTHTFDNYVDYHLKIKLSDVLAKKYTKRNNEFEEENLENGTYLYIAMKGPVENIKFSYDKKQVREQVKKELKEEKEEVKKIWKKELGLEKDESIKEQQNDKNELEFEPE